MELVAIGVKDGAPTAVFQGEDKREVMIERCVGFHNEQPVIVKTFRRVLMENDEGCLSFEMQLN